MSRLAVIASLLCWLAVGMAGCSTIDGWIEDGHDSLDSRIAIEEARIAGGAEVAPDSSVSDPQVQTRDFHDGTTFLHANVSQWPVTSSLIASVNGGTISFPHSKAQEWPVTEKFGKQLAANVWAVVQIDGKWYAGTWEWLYKGQTSKPIGCWDGSKGDHFKVSPLNQWKPTSGERIGIFVSGLARDATRTVKERSNISWVVYP